MSKPFALLAMIFEHTGAEVFLENSTTIWGNCQFHSNCAPYKRRVCGCTAGNKAATAKPIGVKLQTKDSIFTDLFSIPENLLELCRVLLPKDTGTRTDDLREITTKK